MQINILQATTLFRAIAEVKEMNGTLSPKLSANFAYLRPEIRQFLELNLEERKVFAEIELNIPLLKISEKDLPDRIAPDMYESFNIICTEPLKNKKSNLQLAIEASRKN